MRIDAELVSMLRKHHPIWVNTHFNHPNEVTPDARRACEMLADAGIPVVAVSASVMGYDHTAAMEAGCSGFIVKPIDTRQFAKTVALYIP
jgi:L-lysine 2,3-aminomutase